MTRESEAFVSALQVSSSQSMTACVGWTAHELVAHVASGADAFARQIEAYLAGEPVPEFGSWQARELPLRAMPSDRLGEFLIQADKRMDAAFSTLLARDRSMAVDEIGWGLPIAELVNHMRQEYAIHRWDVVGDDDEGRELLSSPDLVRHSVELLSDSLLSGLSREDPSAEPMTVRLRSEGSDDVVLTVDHGQGTLGLGKPVDAPDVITTDPASRLLLIWGRRPTPAARMSTTLAPERLARTQALLAGY